MASHTTCVYGIVPPHLLRAIADNSTNDPENRQTAARSLSLRSTATVRRVEHLRSLTQPRGYGAAQSRPGPRSIVPEHLFQAIIDAPDTSADLKACAQRDLEHLRTVHAQRLSADQSDDHVAHSDSHDGQHRLAGTPKQRPPPQKGEGSNSTFYRAVYDAGHTEDYGRLPGKQVRIESQPASGDKAIDDAFDNCGLVLQFFKEKFNWNSIDNKGMHVISSCHFGDKYENAFWDPDMMQMVFGDGGDFLHNFAQCRDVIGHEMTHAITEHTSPLDYEGQSGALNEHISDCFGIMVKQMAEQETADKADWLIGEGCLLPGVKGVALRNMKAPGTAYNDKRFGKDPQPANMKDFKPMKEDNGGVHIYSGIPNKAFYLSAVAFGGFAWEKAGQIWWKTMTSGRIPPRCTFMQFADTTTDMAEELYGDAGAAIVRKAWNEVGVVRKSFA